MKIILNPARVALNYINHSSSKSIIGFSRSLLAISILLTLIFNDINVLIPPRYLSTFNLHAISLQWNFFLLFGTSHLFLAKLLAIVILIIVISGWFMQVTAILHVWVTVSFVLLRQVYVGGDNINMLLTLLLVPVCIFDSRKNHWDNPVHPANNNFLFIQSLFLFFIKIQVAYIYFDSVFHKLHTREWRDGTVIYYWFNNNFFGLNPPFSNIIKPLLERLPFLVCIAWGTMLLEALIAVGFLFSGKIKWVLLKWGIIFHFCILLVHGFASFFFAMSAALFLYLYPTRKPSLLGIVNTNNEQ